MLGLVVVALAVMCVLGVRVILAARAADDAVPVAPAAVGSPAASMTGQLQVRSSGGGSSTSPTARPPASVAARGGAPVQTAARLGPVPAGGGSVDPGVAPATGGQVIGATADARAGDVVVDVVGRVRRPGVVHLPQGSRVEQAVTAAGGARSDADLSRVNLARLLVDGEQIVVPRPGEPATPAEVVEGAPVGAAASVTAGAAGHPTGPVDVNTATLAELDTLPGVGPVLAQRIVDWRTQNGRFTSVDELGEVSGIGDAVLARLRPLVRL